MKLLTIILLATITVVPTNREVVVRVPCGCSTVLMTNHYVGYTFITNSETKETK